MSADLEKNRPGETATPNSVVSPPTVDVVSENDKEPKSPREAHGIKVREKADTSLPFYVFRTLF